MLAGDVVVAFVARDGLVDDDGLGGEEQTGDGSRVLQGRPGDLGRVDDAGLEQVLVVAGGGVEAVGALEVANPLDDDTALHAGVDRDLLQRLLERAGHDADTGGLVADHVVGQLVDPGLGPQQGDATAGHHALLDRSLGGADRVLDAVLLLLELHLGGGADLDDGHTAGELGQALLELLGVVVGVGVLELGPDLVDPALDVGLVAGTLDEGGLVLGDGHDAGPAQHVEGDVVELEADVLGDDLATGEDGEVLQHGLAALAEAGGLDRDRLERAPDLVDDQGGEGLALDVLGDDHQRLGRLHDLLEHRQQVADGRDLARVEQDVGVVEDRLHALGVGDEVGGDVALVEAHALDQLQLHAEGLRLLDGDDAVLAHLVDGVGDGVADLLVGGGDGRHLGDLLLGLDLDGDVLDALDGPGHGGLDALLERHGVGAGGHVAQALADHGPGEDGGGGGAVTGDVVGLLGHFLDQLGADALVGVLELDLLGDGHAVVGDRGCAPLLVEDDVAALGAERYPYCVGQLVHAALEGPAGALVERDHLGHRCVLLRGTVSTLSV